MTVTNASHINAYLLDARDKEPGSSLADLSEEAIVARLMGMYQEMARQEGD